MKSRRMLLIAGLILSIGLGCDRLSHRDIYSGTLEMNEHSLGAKSAGRVASLLVDEGSEVKKGQLLATLDRYEQAKRDYDRAAKLYERGGIDHQTLEYAVLALEDQQIVSPVDGIVLIKVHDVGEVLNAGAPVVVVGDRQYYWVKIFVPEGIVNRLHLNDRAWLQFDGLNDTFEGRVSFVASKAEFTPRNIQTAEERVTQTFAVKVSMENPPAFLRPGVACDVRIDLKD